MHRLLLNFFVALTICQSDTLVKPFLWISLAFQCAQLCAARTVMCSAHSSAPHLAIFTIRWSPTCWASHATLENKLNLRCMQYSLRGDVGRHKQIIYGPKETNISSYFYYLIPGVKLFPKFRHYIKTTKICIEWVHFGYLLSTRCLFAGYSNYFIKMFGYQH